MTGFVDSYMSPRIPGFSFTSLPKWSTNIVSASSGTENRNMNWEAPLHTFTSPEGVRCWEDVEDLRDMWWTLGGPAYSFAFRDPSDFASTRLSKAGKAPPIFPTDQVIAEGDGVTRVFQLVKSYTFGGQVRSRKIVHPVVSTVLVAINALAPATAPIGGLPGGPYTWTVDRLTGNLSFDHAPQVGQVITAGYYFDVEARFEGDDSLQTIIAAYQVGGFADLTFQEVRPCSGS